MLLQMGQSGQVGSPEYLLAAGEMQARKNVRQQAAMGQPQQPPVIAELLTGIDMPQRGGQQMLQDGQQMPQMAQAPQQALPEDTGIGALPAPNMEQLDQPQYADGGVVAFSPGGSTGSGLVADEIRALEMMDPAERKEYYRQKFQAREAALKSGAPARTPSAPMARAPGFFGLAGRAASASLPFVSMGWDSLFGTPDEEVSKLKAFDAAKATLKDAGFTDKDISNLSTEDVYRMASGYQPQSRSGTSVAGPATPGDLRRLESEAGDPYVTGRGLTPDQSAANIAAARGQGGAPGGTPAAGAPSNAGLFGQVKSFMDQFYPASTETVPTEAAAVQSRLDALKAAGVDMDPNKDLREQVMAERAGRAAEREKAGWEALGMFGLTLSSTPGDFLSAIGKAGLPALKQYSGDIKELKKLSREDDRLLAQLKSTDNELKLKVTQSGLDERQKIIDRIQNERARSGQIAASVFGGIASLEASRESKATTTTENRKSVALKEANDAVDRMTRDDPILARDPARVRALRDSLYSQFLQQLTSGASSAPAASSANIAARFDAKGNLIR